MCWFCLVAVPTPCPITRLPILKRVTLCPMAATMPVTSCLKIVGQLRGNQPRVWIVPSTGLIARAWFSVRISFPRVHVGAELTLSGSAFREVIQAAGLDAILMVLMLELCFPRALR
jgi:hypothetical protein